MNEQTNAHPTFRSPRPYLSWSQISLFERSPEWYVRKYLYAQEEEQSPSMRLGKRLALALESQQQTGDATLDKLVSGFPPYPHREFQIEAPLDGVEVPLYGVLDGYDIEKLRIGEYKSGRLWTQKMVDESGQLKMYALLVWLKYKQMPSEIMLHWARTYTSELGELHFTGEIASFETRIKPTDLVNFSARVRSVWNGIKEVSNLHFQRSGKTA